MERIVPDTAEALFLLNAGPEEVYRYLRAHTHAVSLLEETQKALLTRKEPIIRLALAQFADSEEVINEILENGSRDLRIAVLANTKRLQLFTLKDRKTGLLPGEVFDRLLSCGDSQEHTAFFGNPHLDTEVMAEVFARGGKYADLPDERWMIMVAAAIRNPQLQKKRAMSDFVDGWQHHQYGLPFDEIYKLLLRVEPTKQWAASLCYPLYGLAEWSPDTEGALASVGEEQPDSFGKTDDGLISKGWREAHRRGEELYLQQVLKHWKTPPPKEGESIDRKFGESHDLMREAIVSSLPSHSHLIEKMFSYNDVWVRRGAYRVFYPTSPEQLDRFFARDDLHFIEPALHNPHCYRNSSDLVAAISRKFHDLVMFGEREGNDRNFTRDQYYEQLRRLHELDSKMYPLSSEAFERPGTSDLPNASSGQIAIENIERMRAEIGELSRNMRDGGEIKELSGMMKKLSDMVVSHSQISHDVLAASEKRLLARIDEVIRDLSAGFRAILKFLIIAVLVAAAIKFLVDLF